MTEEECDRLRGLLRLSSEPGIPDGQQNAGILILLHRTSNDYAVLLCVRSDELRRHPGEVCFPGGMQEYDENMQETAIREAKEEVGLQPDDFIVLGSLPSFRARFGILLHPTVALLQRPFLPRLNVREVQRTFWVCLERFLDDSLHSSFNIDENYTVHSFLFDEAHTFGVTALMCILTAMAVLQRMPSFDLSPAMPLARLSTMAPADVIAEVYSHVSHPVASTSKL